MVCRQHINSIVMSAVHYPVHGMSRWLMYVPYFFCTYIFGHTLCQSLTKPPKLTD